MANILIEKVKEEQKLRVKHRKKYLREMEKHQTKQKFDNLKTQTDDKVKAIEYYNNLSEGEKKVFQEELKKKEYRDNYVSYLKYVYGSNYVITKFHLLLAKICENVVKRIENGEKVRLLLSVPPQFGKLLANDTPILTRNGWKKHGDLVIGDEVINHNGNFVKVTHIFPKQFANKKITFTNGEEICCHENHEWVVYDRAKHGHPLRTLETNYLEQEYENSIVGRGHRYRFLLPTKQFEKGEEKELFVNPYVLGVWLGDGKRTDGTICACKEDRITIDECRKVYPKGAELVHKTTGVIYSQLNGMYANLRKYGLCYGENKKKYIPQEYLTASINQRLELLAGLIDTDGYVDHKHNRISFVTADKELKDTFIELVSTFGWRVSVFEMKPTISTSGIVGKKVYWQLCFNPTIYIPCRIERKQLRTFSKQRRVAICKIEDIEPIEGNCIEVEGGIYLCGRTMIPTHNSLTCTETLPSWFIGRNPDLRVILTAYNADIAEKFGDKNRQLVKKYGKEIFGLEISDSQDNKTLWDIKDRLGGLFATGLGGSLTSNNGALIIVDDPFKNEQEALNPAIRESVWSNFRSAVMTRQRGKGNAIIVIHTRWHEDDLIGKILSSEIAEEWTYVNLPCIWEKGVDKLLHRKIGETLCPELGFDSKWAESQKKLLGIKTFNAMYQGKPYTEGGEIVKRDFIKFYNKKNVPSVFEEITMSCDLSFGGKKENNDPNGIAIWGRVGGNHYLLDYLIQKMSFTETLERIRYFCGKYPSIKGKIIESKANGNATIEVLNKEIGGFIGYDPKGNSKETRLQLCMPYFEAGNVWFPDEETRPDIEEQIQILLKFPKVSHDEIVDITTQYLLNYQYKYSGRINTDSNFSKLARAIRGLKV